MTHRCVETVVQPASRAVSGPVIVYVRVRIWGVVYRIPVSLQVGCPGALLILGVFSFRSAALPNSLGNRADGFFVVYGFHISPRFRTVSAQLRILANKNI